MTTTAPSATLQPDALFVWRRQDRLVPTDLARHVTETAPRARHLEHCALRDLRGAT